MQTAHPAIAMIPYPFANQSTLSLCSDVLLFRRCLSHPSGRCEGISALFFYVVVDMTRV